MRSTIKKIFLSGSRKSGFSLIEVLVVLGVMTILSVVVFSNLVGRRSRTDLDNTTKQIAAILREAQSRSVVQESTTIWGVHLENSTTTTPFYALFKTSYGTSTTRGYYRMPISVSYATSSIAQGSFLEITFAQLTGFPSTSTSVSLQLTTNSGGGAVIATSSVTINSNGLVTF